MKLIERKYYLEQLLSVKGIPDIKVITGVRRCGKSKLMDAFIDTFKNDSSANIVRIKLNLKKFEKLLNPNALYVQKDMLQKHKNWIAVVKTVFNKSDLFCFKYLAQK